MFGMYDWHTSGLTTEPDISDKIQSPHSRSAKWYSCTGPPHLAYHPEFDPGHESVLPHSFLLIQLVFVEHLTAYLFTFATLYTSLLLYWHNNNPGMKWKKQ